MKIKKPVNKVMMRLKIYCSVEAAYSVVSVWSGLTLVCIFCCLCFPSFDSCWYLQHQPTVKFWGIFLGGGCECREMTECPCGFCSGKRVGRIRIRSKVLPLLFFFFSILTLPSSLIFSCWGGRRWIHKKINARDWFWDK